MLYRNLMLTMVIGGLWHGAAWTFVIWGFYHGALLVIHRMLSPYLKSIQPRNAIEKACWKGLRIFVTFHLVCLGWLIFRATSVAQESGGCSTRSRRGSPYRRRRSLLPVSLCIFPLLLYQVLQYMTRGSRHHQQDPPWTRPEQRSTRRASTRSSWPAISAGGQFIYFQF